MNRRHIDKAFECQKGLSAENEAERKKFSLYRECKTHNWMHIDSCTAEKPTQCPKCRIERLEVALQYYAQPETYYIDFANMAGLPTVCVDNGDIAREALEI